MSFIPIWRGVPPLLRHTLYKKPHKHKVLARFFLILPISQMGSFPHPIP